MSFFEISTILSIFGIGCFILGGSAIYLLYIRMYERGVFVIDSNDIEKDVFRIEMDSFDRIERSKYVTFKVKNIE